MSDLNRAAEAYAEEHCFCNTPGICHGCEEGTKRSFLAGHAYAMQSPEVLALVEALKLAIKLECKVNCADYLECSNEHGPFCLTMTEALAAFEKETRGQ